MTGVDGNQLPHAARISGIDNELMDFSHISFKELWMLIVVTRKDASGCKPLTQDTLYNSLIIIMVRVVCINFNFI